jgi:hypothetical protein
MPNQFNVFLQVEPGCIYHIALTVGAGENDYA